MKDFYYILGLKKNSTEKQIKDTYRKLSLKFHPDVNSSDEFYTEYSKQLNEAYMVLSDRNRKLLFDKTYEEFEKRSFSFIDFEEKYQKLEMKEKELAKREKQISDSEYHLFQKEKRFEEATKSLKFEKNETAKFERKYYEVKNLSTVVIIISILTIVFFLVFINNKNNEFRKMANELEKANMFLNRSVNQIDNIKNEFNVKLNDMDSKNAQLINQLALTKENNNPKTEQIAKPNYNSPNSDNNNNNSAVSKALSKRFKNNLVIVSIEGLVVQDVSWKWSGHDGELNLLYDIERISFANNTDRSIVGFDYEYELKSPSGKNLDSGSETTYGPSFEKIPPGKTKTVASPFSIPPKRNTYTMLIKITNIRFAK
ncbi:MAG: DnaJ domain-containing protein [bacterium]